MSKSDYRKEIAVKILDGISHRYGIHCDIAEDGGITFTRLGDYGEQEELEQEEIEFLLEEARGLLNKGD